MQTLDIINLSVTFGGVTLAVFAAYWRHLYLERQREKARKLEQAAASSPQIH